MSKPQKSNRLIIFRKFSLVSLTQFDPLTSGRKNRLSMLMSDGSRGIFIARLWFPFIRLCETFPTIPVCVTIYESAFSLSLHPLRFSFRTGTPPGYSRQCCHAFFSPNYMHKCLVLRLAFKTNRPRWRHFGIPEGWNSSGESQRDKAKKSIKIFRTIRDFSIFISGKKSSPILF